MTGFQVLPQKSPDGTAQNNKIFNHDDKLSAKFRKHNKHLCANCRPNTQIKI